MKILLINPPTEYTINTFPDIVEESIGTFPPLGLLYIAASIKYDTDWEVEVVDAVADGLTFDQIRERLKISRPDAVGVTVMTHTLISSLEIAKAVKEVLPEAKVIFGGPHAHLYPLESISFRSVDYVVVGEGEETIAELLNYWNQPDKVIGIRGLYYKSNEGSIIHTESRNLIRDLDKLKSPALELVDYRKYYSSMLGSSRVATMVTSRGCPYSCKFCARPNLGNEFRCRSPESIASEVEKYIDLGLRTIVFFDDTFTVNKKRVFGICKEFKQRHFNISWSVRANVNDVDFQMLKDMRSAGCEQINYGVESGNDEILRELDKGITIEQTLKVFKLTKQAGIKTGAYFMIGCPGETKEQMLDTISFALKLDPDYCYFTILVPFPSTRIYTEGLAKGIFTHDYWSEFSQNPEIDFKPQLWIEKVTEKQMRGLLAKAYKKFYMRPGYILKKIIEIRSFNELTRKIKAGFAIMKFKAKANDKKRYSN